MEVKCRGCGSPVVLDENVTDSAKCPHCGESVTLKESAPQVYEKIEDERKEFVIQAKAIVDGYSKTGNYEKIKMTVAAWNNNSYRRFNLLSAWRTFISDAAEVAANKKHTDLQIFLKRHARDFDNANGQSFDNSLYVSLMKAHPNIGNVNDWDDLIRQTDGDTEKFAALNESLINYINKYQDKAFAMDIFNIIANKENEWASVGRAYLRILLSSKDVVANVFPLSAFNGRTKKFARSAQTYCKKYLDNEITFEETEFGKTYLEACRRSKRRNIIIVSSVIAAVLIASIVTFLCLNAVNKESITFDIDKVIEVTYGEDPDLSNYKVSYKKNSGASASEQITVKMLDGYDPEKIGTQTVSVNFHGVKTGITVRVNAATLKTPVLEQSRNYVTWDFVANARDYSVYVNSTSSPIATTKELSYDLSTISQYGNITVSVVANAGSEKYRNSVELQAKPFTKLQAPANLKYERGKLTWDSVDGAAAYELTVNGIPYTVSVNSYDTNLSQGDNQIAIIAKSSSESVIDGVTSQAMFYQKIEPITSLLFAGGRVSWNAEASATVFSVYVDGSYWKDFYRNYFTVADEFLAEFSETEHAIGVVCKSSTVGAEASEMVSYGVYFGNGAAKESGVIKWNSVGTGATYSVRVNGGTEYKLSSPVVDISDVQWQEGENTVTVTAIVDDKTVILEAVTVVKRSTPSVSVVGGNWLTDGNQNNRYSVNGGEWTAELPAAATLAAGDYTIVAKQVTSSDTALEVESEPLTVKVRKLAAPTFEVSGGELVSLYDQTKYELSVFYCEDEDGSFSEIKSLSEIAMAGNYFVKVKLRALSGTEDGFDYVLESDYSTSASVVKLEAPSVFYTEGESGVTSDATGVKFYYVHNGEECELKDGLIANLPEGIFEIYARKIAQANNELTSENTPENKRAKVFNMNITLSINSYAGSQSQFYAVFGGCDEINELTFSYELRYYDRNGNYIGNRVQGELTLQKNPNISNSNIMTLINYRLNISFEQGYTQTDVYTVELIVTLSSGENEQQLSARMTVN